ncbi:MAG: putative Type IV pilus pilin [Parcubacteria bacterium C7867-003]|nr:MAG: putative Type IV pilus pilin [Parcubacteria bacterium C7867-003]
MNFNYKKNNTKGFTLVETLVAISILTISILAGFTAVQESLRNSITAKNQITAFYLVQDAMEYIKNVRDENALNFLDGNLSSTWLKGISEAGTAPCWHGGGGAAKSCYIDTTLTVANGSINNCTGTCPDIRREASSGLMGYNAAWTPTQFKRTIQLQEIVPNEEVRVTITISWTQGVQSKSFQVSQSLFNRLQ